MLPVYAVIMDEPNMWSLVNNLQIKAAHETVEAAAAHFRVVRLVIAGLHAKSDQDSPFAEDLEALHRHMSDVLAWMEAREKALAKSLGNEVSPELPATDGQGEATLQ